MSCPSAYDTDLFADTPRVQLSVYNVSARWLSELGWDTPSRYLAPAGTPVKVNNQAVSC